MFVNTDDVPGSYTISATANNGVLLFTAEGQEADPNANLEGYANSNPTRWVFRLLAAFALDEWNYCVEIPDDEEQ